MFISPRAPWRIATIIIAIVSALPAPAASAETPPSAGTPAAARPVPHLSSHPTPIESLGPPTEGFEAKSIFEGGMCYRYRTVSRRSPIVMGGKAYRQGFQVSTLKMCLSGTWTWTWHIAALYTDLTACVGLVSDDTDPATLSFLGPTGKALTFGADGRTVYQTTLFAGLPTSIFLSTTQLLNLTIRTSTAGAIIGFGNDSLNVRATPALAC
jgi:hypothetical protein